MSCGSGCNRCCLPRPSAASASPAPRARKEIRAFRQREGKVIIALTVRQILDEEEEIAEKLA
jgi:hypothetical protein